MTARLMQLLVEDEQVLLELIAEVLEDEGFNTCTATTSDQSANLIENSPKTFQLLATDPDLPGKCNGIGLAQLAHRYYPSLLVLYMTGRPDKVDCWGQTRRCLPNRFPYGI